MNAGQPQLPLGEGCTGNVHRRDHDGLPELDHDAILTALQFGGLSAGQRRAPRFDTTHVSHRRQLRGTAADVSPHPPRAGLLCRPGLTSPRRPIPFPDGDPRFGGRHCAEHEGGSRP